MSDTVCPHCGDKLVRPRGRPRSKFLLVGEAPGILELARLSPFVGPTGDVLTKELQRVGIATAACRMTNLWLHSIPTGKENAEIKKMCFEFCLGKLWEQINDSTAVFLMGSELSTLFAGGGISHFNGVQIHHPVVHPDTIMVMGYNPAIAIQEEGVVGDFRFAVERFAELTRDMYKEMILNG